MARHPPAPTARRAPPPGSGPAVRKPRTTPWSVSAHAAGPRSFPRTGGGDRTPLRSRRRSGRSAHRPPRRRRAPPVAMPPAGHGARSRQRARSRPASRTRAGDAGAPAATCGQPFPGSPSAPRWASSAPPPDACLSNQAANGGEIALADPEPGANRRGIERREHRLRPEARAGADPEGRGTPARCATPLRQGVRHRGECVPPAPKTASNRGAVDVEGRGQHEDVGRFEIVVVVEEAEKLVVQHLGFTHRRVTDVNLDRVVGAAADPHQGRRLLGLQPPVRLCTLARKAKIEEVTLYGGQPAASLRRLETLVESRARDLDERIERISSRPSYLVPPVPTPPEARSLP